MLAAAGRRSASQRQSHERATARPQVHACLHLICRARAHYLAECKALGFDVVELSTGFISLPTDDLVGLQPHATAMQALPGFWDCCVGLSARVRGQRIAVLLRPRSTATPPRPGAPGRGCAEGRAAPKTRGEHSQNRLMLTTQRRAAQLHGLPSMCKACCSEV